MIAQIRRQAVWSITCLFFLCVAVSAHAANFRDRLPFGDTVEPIGGALLITEDTTWDSSTDLSQYEYVYVKNGATITIVPGSTIKIRLVYVIRGNIIAKGTQEQMITITRVPSSYPSYAQYDDDTDGCVPEFRGTIYSESNSYDREYNTLTFEYTRFIDLGGFYIHGTPEDSCFNYIEDPGAPIIVYGGRNTFKHCIFMHNQYADIFSDLSPRTDADYIDKYVHVTQSDFYGNASGNLVRSFAVFSKPFDECRSDCSRYNSPSYQQCLQDDRGINYCCWEKCLGEPHLRTPRNVIFTNNWYGSPDEPTEGVYNTMETASGTIEGDVTLEGWAVQPNISQGSNVLFLPGIKASRLYGDNASGKSVKVWEPSNNFETDWLRFADDGTPLANDGVYTKDVIDEIGGTIFGGNIYKSFLADLKDMKARGDIADYLPYAYDWRYDINDILFNGTAYPNGEKKKLLTEIERLAASSYSGTVTIVAHSNGGLLAKALARELEQQHKDHLVDTIILVGSPQMGTPKSILSFLYGYDEKLTIPWLMDSARARTLVETMPGAYALLPSAEYFARTKDDVIQFHTKDDAYRVLAETYGYGIEDYDEFAQFMTGEGDGREKPPTDRIDKENIVNKKLLKRADVLHDVIDGWNPSGAIKVIQIAGWGLDTIQGVDYRKSTGEECEKAAAASAIEGIDCTKAYQTFYEPRYTVDGDEVVVAPSALMMEKNNHVRKYWFDLEGYNKRFLQPDKRHSNILETKNVLSFINEVIVEHRAPQEMPQYFSTSRPTNDRARIRMSLYSPLDIHLYDQHGNHTGPVTTTVDGKDITVIETNIPNSYYDVFDDRKYVGWGGGSDVRIELDGYDTGVYTLHLQEVVVTASGEKNTDYITFADLPTTDQTTVRLSVPQGNLAKMTSLTADYDGDGMQDYDVRPTLNSTVRLTGTEVRDDAALADDIPQDTPKSRTPQKASIDRWTAKIQTKSGAKCPERIVLTLFGKHFDKDVVVRIGGTKAKDVTHYNSKKISATFCVQDVQSVKTGPLRSITAQNPKTKADKAGKKIDISKIIQ